ncbi:hypothetical protein XENORESO_012930 [Xenotaenia resolanae]|uniref:Uncharacterized protein n=1 Tax=Xenotaenia resolanae TaxID=208358 RepID=A0ABV0VWK3_9TELE
MGSYIRFPSQIRAAVCLYSCPLVLSMPEPITVSAQPRAYISVDSKVFQRRMVDFCIINCTELNCCAVRWLKMGFHETTIVKTGAVNGSLLTVLFSKTPSKELVFSLISCILSTVVESLL